MTFSQAILATAGLAASLMLGAAFSVMESAVLALNRARLLELFGSDATHGVSEQAIFRDTKDTYFVSRLGLFGTLALAGFCGLRLARGLVAWAVAPGLATAWVHAVAPALLALLAVPPLYLFAVYAVPRLLMRPAPADPQERLPWALRWFIHCVHPLARLSAVSALLPLQSLLPHHQLTKSDLVSLVTDLEAPGEEPASDPDGAAPDDDGEAADETDEEELVYNILDLENTLVRQVMEPINRVVAVRLGGATVASVLEQARRTGYSRFPVYRERIVDLAGYVNVYDILHGNDPARALESYITPAYYVPEFMRVNQLLSEFLERNVDVAVVVDEHGGSSGWVTREDVLAEIVGEFDKESHKRSRLIAEESEGVYLIDASIDVDDLAEELPLQFEEPPYDTLAGFILMTLGRIPEAGDTVETEAAIYTVEKVDGHRVAQVRIRLRRAGSQAEEPQA